MSLYPYKVFLEIVDQGSFVKASEKLNLTPSAVSHSLKSLEDEFGFRLFRRNKTGAILTDEGNRILPYARTLVAAEKNLIQEVELIQDLRIGTVTIGMFSSVASNWFIKILQSFKQKNPSINVVFFQGDYSDIIEWLETGKVDLAFTSDELARGMNFTPLYRDPLICVASGDFVPENGKTVTAADFASNTLIINKECEEYDAKRYLEDNGIRPDAYYETIMHPTLFSMVEEGMGVCIIPELVAAESPGGIRKYPIEGDPYRTIGLSYSESDAISPLSLLITEEIKNFLENPR